MIIFTVEKNDYSKFISSIISTVSTTNFSEVLSTTKELFSFYSDNNILLCNIINQILQKLHKPLNIPFNDFLVMTIHCESILKKESIKDICTQNSYETFRDLDYTKLDFYEEKYSSTLLICNSILSHPELKKTSLDMLSFSDVFSLVLDTSQEKFIQQDNILDYNKEE